MSNEPVENNSFILGEIRGQLRELIHSTNNTGAKVDALGMRVSALEASENRRVGANGLFALVMKSPVVAWMILLAGAIWAFVTNKLHP